MLMLTRAKPVDSARSSDGHEPGQWRTTLGIIRRRLPPHLGVDVQQDFFRAGPIGDYAQDQAEYEPAGRVIQNGEGRLVPIGHSFYERRPVLVSTTELF